MDNVQSEKEEEKSNTSTEETSSAPVEGTTEEIASTPVENLTSEEETIPLSIEDTKSKDETSSAPEEDDGKEEFSHGEMETALHATEQNKKDKKRNDFSYLSSDLASCEQSASG